MISVLVVSVSVCKCRWYQYQWYQYQCVSIGGISISVSVLSISISVSVSVVSVSVVSLTVVSYYLSLNLDCTVILTNQIALYTNRRYILDTIKSLFLPSNIIFPCLLVNEIFISKHGLQLYYSACHCLVPLYTEYCHYNIFIQKQHSFLTLKGGG